MDKELFNEYGRIKNQIKELEGQLEPMKEKILEQIGDREDPVDVDCGTFTISKRRTYTYPKEIESLEKRLKEEKKIAERTGAATYVEARILKFEGSMD